MIECNTGFTAPKKARIEIIPLIDVIFFLLATFVLFTLSLQKIRSIEVELPIAPPTPQGEDYTTVFIQVSEEGTFYWKRGSKGVAELISAAEIRPRLEEYRRSVATPRVFVRSDRKAKLAAAVMVLDEVRKVGIKQVSVETIASIPGS
jgi:biopolymer transport protein ExbD